MRSIIQISFVSFFATVLTASFLASFVVSTPAMAASDIQPCDGSVLERRLALVQFGKAVDAYLIEHEYLADMCQHKHELLTDVPEVLRTARVCGSTDESKVHYTCLLTKTKHTSQASPASKTNEANKQNANAEVLQVIEQCQYSLTDQSVSCENKSLVGVF